MIWIVLAILILVLYGLSLGGLSLAPWVPTRKKDFVRVAKMAELTEGDNFVELGCGSAGLLIYLAQKHPQVSFTGIEIAWPLFLISWIKIKILGLENIRIIWGDVFKQNLSGYNVIFIFSLPGKRYSSLATKIKSQCLKNTRVLSYIFKIKEFQLVKMDKPSSQSHALYLYKI